MASTEENVRIELWNVVVPLAEVLEASAGPRKRTAHVLIAFVHGAGKRGIGYSIFREQANLGLATQAAQKLVAAVRPEMTALLDIKRFEELNRAGGDGEPVGGECIEPGRLGPRGTAAGLRMRGFVGPAGGAHRTRMLCERVVAGADDRRVDRRSEALPRSPLPLRENAHRSRSEGKPRTYRGGPLHIYKARNNRNGGGGREVGRQRCECIHPCCRGRVSLDRRPCQIRRDRPGQGNRE